MHADDESELERRAVEELLKETNRARARAETMGPTGWMKCPLGSTNKRFLLNTLRSSALQRRSGDRAAAQREEERSDREKHRNSEERERCHRKNREHRKEHTRSHSQSERHQTSFIRAVESRHHSPSHSNRTRSRSPAKDHSAGRKSRDRTQK